MRHIILPPFGLVPGVRTVCLKIHAVRTVVSNSAAPATHMEPAATVSRTGGRFRITEQERTMRPLIALVLMTVAITPPPAWGHDAGPARRPEQSARLLPSANPMAGESGRLVHAGFHEALRLQSQAPPPVPVPPPGARRQPNWTARHPALFGALIGAGAGAVASGVMENELFCSGGDEDCFFHGGNRVLVGAAFGAGIGALVGWLGSL